PVPSMAVYAASKAYVLAMSEALFEELKGTGVTVTALCPGLTDTRRVAEVKAGSSAASKVPKQLVSDPADVAAEAYKALMSGQAVLVPGLPNQITAAWAQVTPRWLTRYVTGFAARRTDWLKGGGSAGAAPAARALKAGCRRPRRVPRARGRPGDPRWRLSPPGQAPSERE